MMITEARVRPHVCRSCPAHKVGSLFLCTLITCSGWAATTFTANSGVLDRMLRAAAAVNHLDRGMRRATGYFQHTLLPRTPENTRLVRTKMTALLNDTSRLLDAHSIRWTVSDGTLIGLERDGDFVPWDDDVDARVHPDDWHKLADIGARNLSAGRDYEKHGVGGWRLGYSTTDWATSFSIRRCRFVSPTLAGARRIPLI